MKRALLITISLLCCVSNLSYADTGKEQQTLKAQKWIMRLAANPKTTKEQLLKYKARFIQQGLPEEAFVDEALVQAVKADVVREVQNTAPENRRVVLLNQSKLYGIQVDEIVSSLPSRGKSFQHLVTQYLQTGDSESKAKALVEIAERPYTRVESDQLVSLLSGTTMKETKLDLLYLLGFDRNDRAGKFLWDYLVKNIQDRDLTATTLRALGSRGDFDAPHLRKTLSLTSDEATRKLGFDLIKRGHISRNEQATELLVHYLREGTEEEKTHALEIAAQIKTSQASREMVKVLMGTDAASVRALAARGLCRLASDSQIEKTLLDQLREEKQGEVSLAIIDHIPIRIASDAKTKARRESIVRQLDAIAALIGDAIIKERVSKRIERANAGQESWSKLSARDEIDIITERLESVLEVAKKKKLTDEEKHDLIELLDESESFLEKHQKREPATEKLERLRSLLDELRQL